MWFIKSMLGLAPPPATWRRKHRLWDKCVIPDMTTLEDSLLGMLFQSSTCWWNPLHKGLLCKELLPSFVDISAGACSVIHDSNKSLNGLHAVFWYHSGHHATLSSVSISSGRKFQATHGLFFPCPPQQDTYSLAP